MTDAAELLSLARDAVDQVVPRLTSARDAELRVATKSSVSDLVTELDLWVERQLTNHIGRHRPDDGILGEEGADTPSGSGVTWIIDPIDGTTNFVYDLPGFTVSVAAAIDNAVVAGLVHDPVRDERFEAALGGGATLNGKAICVSGTDNLATALVATGFSYDAERRRKQAEVLTAVLPRVRDIRRSGGAAYDLCQLACGRVDAYYERGLNPWDHAAGGFIAREAGAVVVDHGPEKALVGANEVLYPLLASLLEVHGGHRA